MGLDIKGDEEVTGNEFKMIDFEEGVTTFGNIIDAVVAVAKTGDTDLKDEFVRRYINHVLACDPDKNHSQAYGVVASNVGYISGYLGAEDMALVRQFFQFPHPIFG